MNLTRIAKNLLLVVLTAAVTLWVVRAIQSRGLPELKSWHNAELGAEFRAKDYPQGIEFTDYLKLEARLANKLDAFTSQQIPPSEASLGVRYLADSPLNPRTYATDWNWSFLLRQDSSRASAVLVHGASDSPYSMRTLGQRLHAEGFNVIAVRLPGHGTLPGELRSARAEDWKAIVRSAVIAASRLSGPETPVLLAGYSTGGALALDYALESLSNAQQPTPAGLILISPAIAITPFAALAQIDLWLSHLPGFDKFAWNSINPEYDPYKYSSFPKQTGRETYLLTQNNTEAIQRLKRTGKSDQMPPVLTFMSIVDATVSVDATVDNLHSKLTHRNDALVLFGVNRTNEALGFLRPGFLESVKPVIGNPDRSFDLTIVSNKTSNSQDVVATTYCGLNRCTSMNDLLTTWPDSVFSLSHVALPFAPDDPIYGAVPSAESPGNFTLGSLQPRGERGILVVPTDQLMRLRYNPFIEYLLDTSSDFAHTNTKAATP